MAKQSPMRKKAETVRVPLIGSFTNRDYSSSKDQRFINMFPETRRVEQIENTKIFINKRPGLVPYKTISSGEGRGLCYFNNKFYVAVGNTVWEDGATPTNKITLTASTGPISMVVGNSTTIGDYLFICDGTSGWYITTAGTATLITDADFPTPHVPVAVYVDGYILVAKGSDIFNCDVDQPDIWQTSSFISAEMFPDPIVAMARQNNQIVVFGGNSVEFFYDAANINGSPLSRNDSTVIQQGIAAPYAIYQNEKYCIFIAQSDSGGRAVWQVEGFQPKRVSDEFIDRILDHEATISTARGYGIRSMGHLFYLVNLPSSGRTLVYDVDEKLWHEWSYNTGDLAHSVFPCNYIGDADTGKVYMQHSSTGVVYTFSPQAYKDDNLMVAEIITNKSDFDNYNRKFFYNTLPVGDSYSTTNTLSVRWTDDDYKTWSAWRDVDLSGEWPALSRCGYGRRRAWNLKQVQEQPLRLESLEITYLEGDS